MKKNRMMRLASTLLILTLLTTSAVSGTFAKYTTSAEASDSARVAKWGVEITANGTTFADVYNTDDTTVTGIAQSVVTSGAAGDALVAPGTTGEMVECTLSGIPEVAFNVTYTAELTLTGWKVTGDWDNNGTVATEEKDVEYCPIIITVNGTDYKQTTTLAAFETAVEGAIAAYSKDYAPHVDLSVESAVATPDVSWRWEFEGDNAKDTALGDQAAKTTASTIDLKVTTTVTQIN